MKADPLNANTFDHERMLIIGVCGHWWQTGDKYQAFVQDCPALDHNGARCGYPPSHGFESRTAEPPYGDPGALVWWPVNGEIWTAFHPVIQCDRRVTRQEIERRALEAQLGLLLAQITQADTDYAVRYGLVLDALMLARRLGYKAGLGWDDQNPKAVANLCRIVVYIDLPMPDGTTEQVSWHMPEHVAPWDGHTDEQKRDRIRAFIQGEDDRGE